MPSKARGAVNYEGILDITSPRIRPPFPNPYSLWRRRIIRCGPAVRQRCPSEVHRARRLRLRIDIARLTPRQLVHLVRVGARVVSGFEVDCGLSVFALDLVQEVVVVEPASTAATEAACLAGRVTAHAAFS